MRAAGLDDIPVVVGGIIPDADAEALRAAGVARVYTPKDFELNRIMLDIVALAGVRRPRGRLMLRALALALGLAAGSASAQDVQTLLTQTLGAGAEALYWLPNSTDPAQAREALGVAYIPIEGSAGSVDIAAGHYAKGPQGFGLVGPVAELFGLEPRDPASSPTASR